MRDRWPSDRQKQYGLKLFNKFTVGKINAGRAFQVGFKSQHFILKPLRSFFLWEQSQAEDKYEESYTG